MSACFPRPKIARAAGPRNNNQQKEKMKSTKLILTGVCLAAAALCVRPVLSAKPRQRRRPAAAASASPMPRTTMAKTPRAIPFRGKIASVDATAKTFTITNKKGESRVFKITDETKIMKDGAAATMADIVADEEVRGSYLEKRGRLTRSQEVKLGPKTDRKGNEAREEREEMEASPTPTP